MNKEKLHAVLLKAGRKVNFNDTGKRAPPQTASQVKYFQKVHFGWYVRHKRHGRHELGSFSWSIVDRLIWFDLIWSASESFDLVQVQPIIVLKLILTLGGAVHYSAWAPMVLYCPGLLGVKTIWRWKTCFSISFSLSFYVKLAGRQWCIQTNYGHIGYLGCHYEFSILDL